MAGLVVRDFKGAGEILAGSRVVAVVGASGTPGKDAYMVPLALLRSGYTVIPVNPRYNELYGVPAYPSLLEIPDDVASSIDIVDVFRPPREAVRIVEDAARLREKVGAPRVIWFQPGTSSEEAVKLAVEKGFTVVDGLCIMETLDKCIFRGECR